MSSATLNGLTNYLPWDPLLLPGNLPTGDHVDVIAAGNDAARLGRLPKGLCVAVHTHPIFTDRLLLRLTYLFGSLQVEQDARSRALSRVYELKQPLLAVGADGRPELAAYLAAKEAADKARGDLEAAEKRLADLKGEYDSMLAAGQNPVQYAKPMAELKLEAGAHRDFVRRLEEKADEAKAELVRVIQEERRTLWRAAKAGELERLADARAKLQREAADFAYRLAGQMLELAEAEKLLAKETADEWMALSAVPEAAPQPPAASESPSPVEMATEPAPTPPPEEKPARRKRLGVDRPGIGPVAHRD